jgi:hypothetical protein
LDTGCKNWRIDNKKIDATKDFLIFSVILGRKLAILKFIIYEVFELERILVPGGSGSARHLAVEKGANPGGNEGRVPGGREDRCCDIGPWRRRRAPKSQPGAVLSGQIGGSRGKRGG